MFKARGPQPGSRWTRTQYLVSDQDERPSTHRSEREYDPCKTETDEECAEWLRQRLTACYND